MQEGGAGNYRSPVMAGRALKPGEKTMYPEGVCLRGILTVGATGAVSSFYGRGFTSITRTAAGAYTLVLEDAYFRLMGCDFIQLYSSNQDITFQLISEDVDNPTQASRTVKFVCKAAATGTDMTSGSKLYIALHLMNSKLSIGEDLA